MGKTFKHKPARAKGGEPGAESDESYEKYKEKPTNLSSTLKTAGEHNTQPVTRNSQLATKPNAQNHGLYNK